MKPGNRGSPIGSLCYTDFGSPFRQTFTTVKEHEGLLLAMTCRWVPRHPATSSRGPWLRSLRFGTHSSRAVVNGAFLSRNRGSSDVWQSTFIRCPFLVDRLVQLASVVPGELVAVFLSRGSHIRFRRARRKMVDDRFVSDVSADLGNFRSLVHASLLRRSTPFQALLLTPSDAEAGLRVPLASSRSQRALDAR